MNTKKNIPLFFILGRERSGTTMLRVNLNNHSKITIPPESPFILHLYKKYASKENIIIDQFLIDLKLEPFLQVWDIDYNLLERQLQETYPPTFQNFCKQILNHQQKKILLLGDKNPTYSLFGNELIKLFPKTKFIWVIRDYRAQVNSMLKVNFEKKIISSLAARWVGFNKEIELLKNRYSNNVLLVKYENLVTKPEEQYTEICDFLSMEYEPSILNTDKREREFYPSHHKSLDEQINTKHVDEWRDELTKNQIRICETVAGSYGEKFGYRRKSTSNPFLYLSVFFGIFYGACYKHFIKVMYSLPLGLRTWINHKIIYRNAPFWKELKEHYQLRDK